MQINSISFKQSSINKQKKSYDKRHTQTIALTSLGATGVLLFSIRNTKIGKTIIKWFNKILEAIS